MSVKHGQRKHAKLSASGSKRWLACTPSVSMEEAFKDEKSVFAAEGERAHELAEQRLKFVLSEIKDYKFRPKDEMDSFVQVYTDYVEEQYTKALSSHHNATILLEHRVNFSEYVPDGFGTADCIIIDRDSIEIIDLKYGKGVPVSAEDNPQLRLYALGALHDFGALFEIEKVKMTIVQPRLDILSTDELNVDELYYWGEKYVKPRAQLALAGKGEFVPGDHCRFCKARHTCRARANANLELLKHNFTPPNLLALEEVNEILKSADELARWVSDVKFWALDQALKNNAQFQDFKVVEGRSNRRYADEQQVADLLLQNGYSDDVIFCKSLNTITALEKEIGKKRFVELLGDYIIKLEGKPTLVHQSDKREQLSSGLTAFAD